MLKIRQQRDCELQLGKCAVARSHTYHPCHPSHNPAQAHVAGSWWSTDDGRYAGRSLHFCAFCACAALKGLGIVLRCIGANILYMLGNT